MTAYFDSGYVSKQRDLYFVFRQWVILLLFLICVGSSPAQKCLAASSGGSGGSGSTGGGGDGGSTASSGNSQHGGHSSRPSAPAHKQSVSPAKQTARNQPKQNATKQTHAPNTKTANVKSNQSSKASSNAKTFASPKAGNAKAGGDKAAGGKAAGGDSKSTPVSQAPVEKPDTAAVAEQKSTPSTAVSEGPPLTLSQAYDLALLKNPDIQATKAQLGEAKADILIASLRINPGFDSDGGFISERTYRVGGHQTFEAPGKRHFRVAVAKDEYDAAIATVAQTIRNILIQVHLAYINWVASAAKVAYQQENQKAFQAIANISQQRYEKKEVEDLDIDQSNMLLQQSKNDGIEAKNDLDQAKIQLAALLTTDNFSIPTLNNFDTLTAIHLPPTDQLIQDAFAGRQDLRANQSSLKAEEDRLRQFRHSIFPDITLGAGYDLVNPRPQYVSGFYANSEADLPIFDHQQGNIARTRATHQRLVLERLALENNIRRDIISSYRNALYEQAQWQRIHTILMPLADKVDDEAEKSYADGKTGINDVIGQHQNAANVRLEALQTYINYQQAINNLEAALSSGIGGGIGGQP